MSSTPTAAQFDTDPVKTLPQPPSEPRSASRYLVLRPHARGGLGEVFVAEDTELGRLVALKEIQARHADHAESRTRFVLEAEITGGLEHPGIVPVYGLGTYADGRPYYAMRFIQGESLKEAIARFYGVNASTQAALGKPDSLVFRQLLSRFISVCQVVAYAHSRGVLHRDLKPANVMLGKFGETLVVDWGLAKTIGRSEGAPDDEPTLHPRSGSDSSATAMGQALGTPAYMSPEQADGRLDRLGPASDIYCLGATLYELLAGRPPFTGDVCDILAHVRRGEVVSPREVRPDVPRPLAAICLKAMNFGATQRYPTADALATDVERWLADEPVSAYREPVRARLRRWVNRHRPLVAGLGAMLLTGVLGLVGLLVQSERAREEIKHERDRAVVARNDARQALDDMTSELTERSLMTQKTLSPEQRQFLQRVLGYYQKFAAEPGEVAVGRARLAEAHSRLGSIHFRLGHKREAAEAYRKAADLLERLAADFPAEPDYRLKLAWSNENLGMMLTEIGDLAAAETATRAALTVKQQLLTEKPDDPEYRSGLATAHRNLALLSRQRRKFEDAASSFRSALDVQQKLVADFPTNAVFGLDMARSRTDLGNIFFEMGRFADAEAELRAGLEVLRQLPATLASDPDYRCEVANGYLNWGRALQFMGKTEYARSAFEAAVSRQERLVAEYPGVPEYRQFLGHMHANLAATKVTSFKKSLTEGRWSLFGRPPAKRRLDLREAETIATSTEATADDAYNAACAFAVAAAAADPPTADGYAARAVTVLRQAFARGFQNISQVLKDSDLEAIRRRADYLELLWDLADGPGH
jgi:serine/threonine-protein kinase